MIEWQPWAIGALGLACTALGWFAREMWSAVKQLRVDLDSLRVHLANEYPSYPRLAEMLRPIVNQLDRIETALSHKADRS